MSRGGRKWDEPHLCASCRSTIPHWKRLCDACWRLLPWGKRKPIMDARDARAPHILASRVAEAVGWLRNHSPAAEAARRQGERE